MPLLSFADIGRLASLPFRKPCSSVSPRPCAAWRLSSSSKRLSSTSSASSSSRPVHGVLGVLGVRGAMWIAFNPEVTAIGCRGCGISSLSTFFVLLEELRNLGCFDFRLADMQSLSGVVGEVGGKIWLREKQKRKEGLIAFAGNNFDTAFHQIRTRMPETQ